MTAQSQPTRRLFLSAGSASAVFGALAQATAASTIATDDPIFAAIERHWAAESRYCTACNLTDEVAARNEGRIITSEDRAEFDAAERDCDEALGAFLTTPPTTVAGARAFLRHCIENEEIEQFIGEALATLLRSPVLAAQH